jgi:hypothetical protein
MIAFPEHASEAISRITSYSSLYLASLERRLLMSGETPSKSHDALLKYFPMVEEAWKIRDAASEYVKNAGREVLLQELMEKVFLPSGQVDLEKTKKEGGDPPKIFFNSPYGLQYRPESKDWIPFRHGPLPG